MRAQLDLNFHPASSAARCKFWLGTHRPNWLYPGARKMTPRGPLFISIRQLGRRKTPYPRSDTEFAVDSGGYSELSMFGRWATPAAEYAAAVTRVASELGTMQWAAIQDWMVEPWIVDGGSPPWGGRASPGTGLSVGEHQRRTVASYLELNSLAPGVRWLPVIQGRTIADYLGHVDMYARSGVDLAASWLVGVGSVCRLQRSSGIRALTGALADAGLSIHGFGVKLPGLAMAAPALASADSMAWSSRARKAGFHREPGAKSSDANCQLYAERWRTRVEETIDDAR